MPGQGTDHGARAIGLVGRFADADTNGQTLTPAQERALKHLSPPIVVPRSLPSGFHLTALTP
jgi:hypothetical protein